MNIIDYVLLFIILVGVVFAVTVIYRQKKSGKCIGCSGCSGACSSCGRNCNTVDKKLHKI